MLITNVSIFTAVGDAIPRGWIAIKDGKITAVGTGDAPSEVLASCACSADSIAPVVIDGNGLCAYPGFIDAHCHVGMYEDSLGFEGSDGNEMTDPVTPHMHAIDAVNPRDRCFGEAARAGVLAVLTGPGSANAIGGRSVAMRTYSARPRTDDMLLKRDAAMKFALGENPKTVYNGKSRTPMTRMATAALIREALLKAREYADKKSQGGDKTPEYNAKHEALIPVLNRELAAHFHAHRADDIFTAIRIAKEFNLDYTIIHCTEGHLIAEELIAENASVITGPTLSDRSKPELSNLSFETPSAVAALNPAICTDHPVIPLEYLTVCAGLAVKNGMSRDDALRAITINAAKIGGINHLVGSIEAGKLADFTLFTDDPLSLSAKPQHVFVGGVDVL